MTLAPRRSPLSLNPLASHPLRDARALQRGAAVQLEPTRGLRRFPARVHDVRPATLRPRPALRFARVGRGLASMISRRIVFIRASVRHRSNAA